MEESDLKTQNKQKVQEFKTFPVPLGIADKSETINLSKNILIKDSKTNIINQALKFHEQGKVLEAVKAYQFCLDQDFNEPRIFSNYGILLIDLNKYIEAENLLRKAIELKPDYAIAHTNLGSLLIKIGKSNEAKSSLQKAIELNPDYAIAHANLGDALRSLNELKKAELSLQKAIELNPNYANAHANLGIVYKELGQLKSAENSLRKAISLKPDFVNAYSNLGNTLRDLGDLQEAEKLQRKAIKLQPNFAKAYSNLGGILKDQGKTQEAKKFWLKAIEIDPKLEKTSFFLAEQLYFEKQYKLAINYLKDKNFHRCQSLYLSCLLCLDQEESFNKYYQRLIDKCLCNAHIGGIIEHANVIYEKDYNSPFCNEAIRYVLWDKISEESFSTVHLNQMIGYLRSNQTRPREQGLLKNGIQTSGNLFSLNFPFINSIKKALELKIELYRNKFKDCKQGFITNWPEKYELRSWMIGMKSGGFLKQHNHEYGWITGSYYLKVPKDYINEIDGNIAFSNQGPDYPTKEKIFNSVLRKVEVRDICLFPSSLFHKTIPFESQEERICFVFDLVQKE